MFTKLDRVCAFVLLAAAAAMPSSATTAQLPDAGMEDLADPLPPVDGRRVALVIGISDYDETAGWDDLPNAAKDAEYIARTLADARRGAARFDVELVTDGTREQNVERFAAKAARRHRHGLFQRPRLRI